MQKKKKNLVELNDLTLYCRLDKNLLFSFAQLFAFWCLFLQLAAVQCMIYASYSKTFIFLNVQANSLRYIKVYFVNLDLSRWYIGPTDITGKAVLDLNSGQVTLKAAMLLGSSYIQIRSILPGISLCIFKVFFSSTC